jgi:GR25 family glycosyltransferase involved in LPS biosynthesis
MIKEKIHSAYIITIKNNKISEEFAKECYNSCVNFNIPVYYWNAFDGTSKQNILIPENLIHESYIKFLKPLNTKLLTTEIACLMSHFSLWCHCIIIDKPIIIFEHDAIVIKQIEYHKNKNSINYLGNIEQYKNKSIQNPSCLVSIEGYDYTFIRAAHAYSIDTSMARNLVSYVIKEGITKQTDVLMRSDYFNIYQDDIYAYENNKGNTTINAFQLFEEPLKKNYDYS